MATKETILTAEGLRKLEDELNNLRTVRRHHSKQYAEHYTPAAVKMFKGRMAYAEARFLEYGLDLKTARKVYLQIYAGPVETKIF